MLYEVITKLIGTVSHPVFIKYPRHCPKRIGLDHIRTSHRIAFVYTFDQIRSRVDQKFVTPFLNSYNFV